ncbi:type I iodothyronine deiodinase-like [Glandiceps talaboti]
MARNAHTGFTGKYKTHVYVVNSEIQIIVYAATLNTKFPPAPSFFDNRDLVIKMLGRAREEMSSPEMFKMYSKRMDPSKPDVLVQMISIWLEMSKKLAVEFGQDPDEVKIPLFYAVHQRFQGDQEAVVDGGSLKQLFQDYWDKVEFLFIYISEVHPPQGWGLGDSFSLVDVPHSIEDRRDAARLMIHMAEDTFTTNTDDVDKIRVVVDDFNNTFNMAYGAQPDRIFVLVGDKLVYVGVNIFQQVMTPERLFVESAREWLETYFKKA